MKERLEQLKEELQKGIVRYNTLEKETKDLEATILRISGAIQVLEELLADEEQKEELT